MAELTDLLAKMQATSTEDAEKEKRQQKIGDRQEKNETAQLDALESLESSFPSAFAAKAEVLVGEKIPFEHSGLLGDIKRGVDGLSLTFGQKFKDFFGSFAGIMPSRPARKRAEAADLAQELIQADTHDIAKAVSESNARGAVEQKERRKKMFGMEGMLARFSGLSALTGKKTGGGKAVEKAREQEAYQNKMLSCCKRTGDAVEELNESFLESLKEKGKLGLGIIIAAIAAPIIAIVAFFKSIAEQIRWMKAFSGEKIAKLFAPIKGLFAEEGFIGKAMKSIKGIFAEEGVFGKAIKSIKGAFAAVKESKFVVGIKSSFTTGWTKLKNFLTPIGDFFKTLVEKGKMLVQKGKTASNIVKWAGTFGKVLGKVFLPITLLMSAWDLITGAMAGWEKEGKETDSNMVTQFIAAIGGGLGELAKSLIGIPLGWLTSGIAWIAKKMGFDEASKDIAEFAEKLPDFIYDLVNAPFDYLKKGVKWLTKLFTEGDPVGELKKFWEKLVGTGNWVVNAIGTALDDVWEWFKSLFDIDFAAIAKAIVPDWAPDFIKEAVGLPVKGPTIAELEGKLEGKLAVAKPFQSESEIKILREQIADLKAKADAGGGGGGPIITKFGDVTSNSKSTHSASISIMPDPVIAALAMTP